MAEEINIAALIDRLPNSNDHYAALSELKTILVSVHPSALKDVVPNISFNVVFECLNTNDREQIKVCCEVLDRLLAVVDSSVVMQHFATELLQGLTHHTEAVQKLSLSQIQRAAESSPQQVSVHVEAVVQLIRMIGVDSLEISKSASHIVVKLGSTSEGLDILFQGPGFEQLEAYAEKSDTIRYRFYDTLVNIAKLSPEALQCCDRSGLLQKMANEIYKDDVLIQLNCLEVLKDLAMCEHGLAYLDQQGIVGKLEAMFGNIESDPLLGFLMPGLVKFFGSMARLHPKEVCERFPHFINTVFQLLDEADLTLRTIAAETIGFIGGTVEGKLALDKQGNKMQIACKRIGGLITNSSAELKVKNLTAVACLLMLKVDDQTTDLLSLMHTWFSALTSKPLDLLMTIVMQPFTELRCAIFDIFVAMAMQPWGQQEMNKYPGFNEYLLDRSTENTKEGKEGKYEIVRTLVESPTAMEIYGRPYFVRLKEYLREGPFYVRVQSEVAMEGAS